MTSYAVVEEGLANASIAFDTLAGSFFGQNALPGKYALYTNVQTGITSMTTELDVIANAPTMRKWVGPRREQRMRAYSQRITLEPYEATLAIARMTLAYRDRQGSVAKSIKQFLGQERVAFDQSTHTAYVSNSGAGPTGYDGVPLFSASHPHASGGGTQSNTGSLAFSAANLDAVVATMASYQFENGTPMQITPTHLRVGPKLAQAARAVVGNPTRIVTVSNTGAEAASGVVAAAAVDNVYNGMLEVIVDPNLVGTMDDWWEVLDLSKGDAKPMQLLVGRGPTPVHQDQMWADRRFQLDEFLYGLEGDWKPDAGVWATAYRNIL